jgi:putative copper export protein
MPLIKWQQPLVEYAGFAAAYATIGATAFRYFVLGVAARDETVQAVRDEAASRAATIGVVGSVIGAVYLWLDALAGEDPHPIPIWPLLAIIVAGIAFAMARRAKGAWPIAALGTAAFAVRDMHVAKWASTVNPLHVIGGSLWLGTLFVMATAGLPAALHHQVPSEHRGPAVAWLVRAFSPLALTGASLLALTGIITAVRHVKYWSALWTTPYGYTLDVKLAFVATVAALGWWNWQRAKPRLGDELAARQLHTSARYELIVAGLVLLITGVLVSLPTPKLP